MENRNLILSNILWEKHPHERYYYVKQDGRIILLRINNFPDEPLYTLINEFDIIDLEDIPAGWVLKKISEIQTNND